MRDLLSSIFGEKTETEEMRQEHFDKMYRLSDSDRRRLRKQSECRLCGQMSKLHVLVKIEDEKTVVCYDCAESVTQRWVDHTDGGAK